MVRSYLGPWEGAAKTHVLEVIESVSPPLAIISRISNNPDRTILVENLDILWYLCRE